MEKEDWRRWRDWRYEVSNYGAVRHENSRRPVKPKLLNGALWVWVARPHRSTYEFVRLDLMVAEVFLGASSIEKNEKLRHIDNDPFNCAAYNLRIVR